MVLKSSYKGGKKPYRGRPIFRGGELTPLGTKDLITITCLTPFN